MQYCWLVVREKDGAVVGQFASRYAAMVYGERQCDGPYKVTDRAPAPTNAVHPLGSCRASDGNAREAFRNPVDAARKRSPPSRARCALAARPAKF